jgi:sulfite dehydrogenase
VVGGGYGGATAAKYLKLWAPSLAVTLVERDAQFYSCPFSNLVIGGNARMSDITRSYDGLAARGIRVVHDEVVAVDVAQRAVRLKGGEQAAYDRLIVSPGVDFNYASIPGLQDAGARERVLHAWKAGPQTLALRRQLEAMRDGGVYAIHIPRAPFRCPPGPYERVCQVADYFRRAKPRSKILVLDTNEDILSKKALFLGAWNGEYKGMIDYQPNAELTDVDAKTLTAKLLFDDVKADVLNVIPPQRAADFTRSSGIAATHGWCEIDWLTYESKRAPGVHVLGDATFPAPAMPKSATMANQQAKVCAAAVVALLRGDPVDADPVMINTCYSFLDAGRAAHIASVHRYDPAQKTMVAVKGAGGLSHAASALEAAYAWGWGRNIWADTLD